MLRITIISFLVSAALAQWTPTPQDPSILLEVSRTPDNKTKGIRNIPITLPVGSSCLQDSDCDDDFSCFNISHALFDFLNRTSHLNELEFLAKKARITGNECVVESRTLFKNFTAEQYIERAMELVAKLNRTLSDAEGFPKFIYDREKLNIKFPNVTDIQKLIQKFNLTELRKPLARQTGGTGAGGLADPNSQSGFGFLRNLMPTFLLTNSSFLGSSGSNEDLWPIFLLSGGFGGGFGESGVKSLLPFILLNNNSGSNDNTLLLIFFLTLFNQPGATRLFSQQPVVPPQPIVHPQPPVPPRRLLPPIPIPPPGRLHPAIAIPPPPTTLPSQSTPTPRPTLSPQGNIIVG